MQLKKQTKIDFHDWRFWYKFIGGLLMIAMILVAWIRGMVEIGQLKNDVVNWFNSTDHDHATWTLDQFREDLNLAFGKNPKIDWISIVPFTKEDNGVKMVEYLKVGAGFGGYTVETFSFFTILSNAAIGIWMLVAALKPKHEGVKGFVGYESTLIVTTTITVTMLIYMCMLLPVKISSGEPLDWLDWVIGMSEHLVFPLLIILYVYIVWKPNKTMTNREYMQQGWWKIIAIILVYGVYALVRGEMRYQGNEPYLTQYPYFFLYIHDSKVLGLPGYAWFIIAIVAIIGICLGFSIGYNTIINKKMQKTNSATKKN